MQISKLVLKVGVVMMSGLISTVALGSNGMNQDTTACLHAPQKNKPRERGNKVVETAKNTISNAPATSGTRNSNTQK